MQQLTDDDLLNPSGGNNSNVDEKERAPTFDMPTVRQARPEFSYFMNEELRYDVIPLNRIDSLQG